MYDMPKKAPGDEQYHDKYITWCITELAYLHDHWRFAWGMAYPTLDLRLEIAKSIAWLIANPNKRKKNMSRYINNWFKRASNPGKYSVDRLRASIETAKTVNTWIEDRYS